MDALERDKFSPTRSKYEAHYPESLVVVEAVVVVVVVVVVVIVACLGDVYCDLLSTRAAVQYESAPRLHLVLCVQRRVWAGRMEGTRVRKVAGSMSGPGICFFSLFYFFPPK